MKRYDVAIVGAGIAGASLAAELAPHARVLMLEMEDQPGYHATGRSAAFWSETYGGPLIQPLTTASHAGLAPFLEPLGSLHIGRAAEAAAVERLMNEFEGSGVDLTTCDPRERIAGLRDDWALGIWEPSCAYIDVGGLHQQCLARARRAGAVAVTGAELHDAVRRDRMMWRIDTAAGQYEAAVLVNAAGAWADRVARRAGVRPAGIQPYRRTMVQLRTEPGAPAGLPHVAHIGGDFYFKPAGDRLWLTPHDEIASDACDAQPEEIDVAIAIDRLERAVDWRVTGVDRKWAGLRSFAPDRLPVYGFDPAASGFFWCAGQGGFGIQTAPAAAKLAAGLLLGMTPDADVARIDAAAYSVDRLRD